VTGLQPADQRLEDRTGGAVDTAFKWIAHTVAVGARRTGAKGCDSAGRVGDAAGGVRFDKNIGRSKGEGQKAIALFD
jgi:hypothetical protein